MFHRGQPLRVHVASEPEPLSQAPAVMLELRSAGGTTIFRTSTALDSADDGAQLAFEIPDLALLGGDYDLVARSGQRADGARPRPHARSRSRAPAGRRA